MRTNNDYSTITRELHDGEELVWHDRPSPGTVARAWIFLSFFGLFFFGFSIFWIVGAAQSGDPLFPLFGIPFVLIGFSLVSAPLWQMFVAKGTLYAITDKRVLILLSFPWKKIISFYADDLDELERKWMKGNGTGTVIFAKRKSSGRHPDSRPDWGFFGVGDAKRVEGEIMKLKEGAKA